MTTLLLSHRVARERGAGIARNARAAGRPTEVIALPEDREARLPDAVCASVEVALFSGDVFPDYSRQFFSTVRKAPNLKWLHAFNVGVDHPIYTELLERGVRLTTSAGSTAAPIAQTAITALLMLSRRFPRWLAAQAGRRWEPMRGDEVPRDLQGQTAIVVGLGHIGREIARLARALGLRVVGVRRSARTAEDPVDELHPPERLGELLQRADWLILACPLTPATRGLLGAELLARLPKHAHLINIARGEIVDEAALTDALREGRLAGAYLDVFEHEPLPEDSPLWNLPNVLVTPHNSSAASGNDQRVMEIFLDNLERWQRGEALVNEVNPSPPTPPSLTPDPTPGGRGEPINKGATSA
jgi:phosphoglycerate dehydrogenase-like enzyme